MYWALTGRNVPTLIPRKNELGVSVTPNINNFKTPNEIYSQIPEPISNLIMDCVKEKAIDRPASMTEIIFRLDEVIRNIFGSRISNAAT